MKPSITAIHNILRPTGGLSEKTDAFLSLWDKQVEHFSLSILNDSSYADAAPIGEIDMANYISKAAVLLHLQDNRSSRRRAPEVRREHSQKGDRREAKADRREN